MRGILTSKQRGSSILMVLLIISGVLVVVFAAQRISLVQFSQSSREEDNLVAYYAARAGIEDGLARYRFNRDIETESNKVFRFGVTTAKYPTASPYEVDSNSDLSSTDGLEYDPSEQYYDLAVKYRVPYLGFTNGAGYDWANAKIATKDSSTTLTGFFDDEIYYLRSAFQFQCTDTRAFVQLEQISETGAVLNQAQLKYQTGGVVDSRLLNTNMDIKTVGDLASTVRFRPYFCDVKYAFTTSKTTSGSGATTNHGPDIDSLTTTITATGYYGASKRTLVAEVNRISGTLIGIYDYNLYAGGGNVSR